MSLRCFFGRHRWVLIEAQVSERHRPAYWTAVAVIECRRCGTRDVKVSPRDFSWEMFGSEWEARAWARGQAASAAPDSLPEGIGEEAK
jgi:hypothetical protein